MTWLRLSLLLTALLAVMPANAGSITWDLSGVITCTDLDSTYTNLQRPTCGIGDRITHGGLDFSTVDFPIPLHHTGGTLFRDSGDVLTNVSFDVGSIAGRDGYIPADFLTFEFRFASAVNYSSAFSVPVTADMRFQSQESRAVASGMTGTLSFAPGRFVIASPITSDAPEPRSTLLLAGIALAAILRARKFRMAW